MRKHNQWRACGFQRAANGKSDGRTPRMGISVSLPVHMPPHYNHARVAKQSCAVCRVPCAEILVLAFSVAEPYVDDFSCRLFARPNGPLGSIQIFTLLNLWECRPHIGSGSAAVFV